MVTVGIAENKLHACLNGMLHDAMSLVKEMPALPPGSPRRGPLSRHSASSQGPLVPPPPWKRRTMAGDEVAVVIGASRGIGLSVSFAAACPDCGLARVSPRMQIPFMKSG